MLKGLVVLHINTDNHCCPTISYMVIHDTRNKLGKVTTIDIIMTLCLWSRLTDLDVDKWLNGEKDLNLHAIGETHTIADNLRFAVIAQATPLWRKNFLHTLLHAFSRSTTCYLSGHFCWIKILALLWSCLSRSISLWKHGGKSTLIALKR